MTRENVEASTPDVPDGASAADVIRDEEASDG
jgi:hypothetical protein